MTDLDTATLRQALKVPGDQPHDHGGNPVDVTQIMSRGRQLRRRRRLAAVAGGTCAVAILAGTATAIVNLTAAPSAPGQPAAPAQHGTAHHGPVVGGTVYQRPTKPGPSPRPSSLPAVPSATGLPATPVPEATRSSPNGTAAPSAIPTSTALPTIASQPVPTTSPIATSPATSAAARPSASRSAPVMTPSR